MKNRESNDRMRGEENMGRERQSDRGYGGEQSRTEKSGYTGREPQNERISERGSNLEHDRMKGDSSSDMDRSDRS